MTPPQWRHTIAAAILLGVVCAGLVWWLERFNRQRLIDDFREQLDRLPTFKQGDAA